MPQRWKKSAHRLIRPAAAVLVAVLLTGLGSLATPQTADARVSIVPGTVRGGGTETFSFRLANERPDTATTRLELVFPRDIPIAFVEVTPVRGWTATITPRPLNPPVRAGDQLISEVVGSIVLEGGSVGPGQFEQFLVTMGPLPSSGRMVFEATQTFGNGAVERWTGDGTVSAPGAPVIAIDSGAGPAPLLPPAPVDQGGAAPEPADRPAAGEPADDGGSSTPALLLGTVVLGVAIVVVSALRAYQRRRSSSEDPATPHTEPTDTAHPETVEVADR